MPSRRYAHPTKNSGGQALPEFALVLPVLMLILAAILQFAFVFGTQIGLTNAAREAARFASVIKAQTDLEAQNVATQVQLRLESVILPTTVQSYQPSQLDATLTQVCYQSFTDQAGDLAVRVKVDVGYGHPLFIPLIADILSNGGGVLTVTSSEQLPVDNPPLTSTTIPSSWKCYT